MAMGKIFKGGEKVAKKAISKSQKAKTTTDVKFKLLLQMLKKLKVKENKYLLQTVLYFLKTTEKN
jgi:hypothetical protein